MVVFHINVVMKKYTDKQQRLLKAIAYFLDF
jgi:hypothetical protein